MRESIATRLDSSAPAPSRPVVLVVDDNEENRDMLARRLARQSYEVLRAAGGLAALETLATRPVDLVLLDVMMPGMNGLDVLRVIRQTRAPTHLPVISDDKIVGIISIRDVVRWSVREMAQSTELPHIDVSHQVLSIVHPVDSATGNPS